MIKNKNNINDNTQNLFLANTSNVTSVNLEQIAQMKQSKSLLDDVNDYLKIMKRGEYFDKIINSKGRTRQKLLVLSQDEKVITINYIRCCFCKNDIYIEKILSCEIGHSNNFYSKKKFENFFTIELNDNQSYEFYHENQKSIKSWVNCINYLIQKKQGKSITPNHKMLTKVEISKIWQKEIIPNWSIYRKYLHDKNKYHYFTKKVEINKKKMDKYESLEENIKILNSNHQEILYLWTLGLPSWLRKYLWSIVIGNDLEISEKLFEGYSRQIVKESMNNNLSEKENLYESKDNKDNLINDLKDHINIYYQKYEPIIKSENKINFKTDIYLIVHSFCNYRQDILYTKEITELTSFLYLNSDNNFECFRILCNFIITNYLFNFVQNDILSIKNYYEFFEILCKKYTPLLYNYIQTLNISLFPVFYRWTKNLFLKVFPYELSLIIFDNFIIRGKIFIFQVSLAILIFYQKDLIHYDSNKLNLFLKKGKYSIDENNLFAEIDKLNIRKEYEDFFDVYTLGKEKIELFQDL